MIIVLKNADFSQSNIGTLSTWRISRSLGAGATYDGPTSVDKDAAFSATVTIAEGYEIGTAGVTITMGGVVLSGAHSISGNVITITIASVTGNVLIKVPTVNTATGEEEEPDVPVTPDVPGGDNNESVGNIDITDEFTWTSGANTAATGGNIRDSNWLVSNWVDVSNYSSITFTQAQTTNQSTSLGYTFKNSNGAVVGCKNNGGVSYEPVTVTVDVPEGAKTFRTMWYSDTNTNITASNYTFSCTAVVKEGGSTVEPDVPETPSNPATPGNLTEQFVWTEGRAIRYADGTVTVDSNWKCSDYVNINGLSTLSMTVVGTTTAGQTSLGYAFYDNSKARISGTMNTVSQAEYNYTTETIAIPTNAAYIRTTWFSANHKDAPAAALANEFSCSGS